MATTHFLWEQLCFLGYFLTIAAVKAMVIVKIISSHFLCSNVLFFIFVLVFSSYKWNNNTSVDDEHHCVLVYYVNIFLEQQKVQEHCSIISIVS
jgi:hypothetical protein